MVVLPDLDGYIEFPDRGQPVETENTHCEPPRREWKTKWGFSKSVPYHLGGWTTAEYTVAHSCGTICNGNYSSVRAFHNKRAWPTSVEEFAAMIGRAGQGTGHVHEKVMTVTQYVLTSGSTAFALTKTMSPCPIRTLCVPTMGTQGVTTTVVGGAAANSHDEYRTYLDCVRCSGC